VVAPYSLKALRKENPSVSFAEPIDAATLSEYNVYVVKNTVPPKFDAKTHYIKNEIKQVDGEWFQVWSVFELPENEAAENIRQERNAKLKESDWTQLKDSPGDTTEWVEYRQGLRDITQQDGFPFKVVWPDLPTGL